METKTRRKYASLQLLILTVGVFGIINTEMGVVGIIPLIAETFNVTIPQAGWTVSAFAFMVAIAGPIMPLLFSGINRKKVMLLALSIFVVSNIISMVTTNFTVILIARIIPAIFHPIYVSMAFSVAASSVPKEQAPKAVSKIFIGVSAGMVLGVPVTSLIASETNFQIAMLFFAIVNVLVLIATIFLIPSIPVKERLSYGAQLSVLKKAITWNSIIAVTLINGAMFGFFSFMSDYLNNITGLSFKIISIMLFIYGGANIIGNLIAGRLLVKMPSKTIKTIPFFLIAVYVALFFRRIHFWHGSYHPGTGYSCRNSQQQHAIYDNECSTRSPGLCQWLIPDFYQSGDSSRNGFLWNVYQSVQYTLCRDRNIYILNSGYRIYIPETI